MDTAAPFRAYSRAEDLSDAAVHLAGLAAVVVGVPALVAVAAMHRGDAAAMAGVAVYGAALALMIGASALYNMVRRPGWAWLLRRLDHAAIYLKIAGTYTPFTLLTGEGMGLTLGLWVAALAGVTLKLVAPPWRFRWPALALYLAMGWAGFVAGGPLIEALSPGVIRLMLAGGALYTAGVAFHLWDRLPFHNTIWHVFVLGASAVFYAAVTLQVLAA